MYSTKFVHIKLDKRPFKYTHANIKKKNKELHCCKKLYVMLTRSKILINTSNQGHQ